MVFLSSFCLTNPSHPQWLHRSRLSAGGRPWLDTIRTGNILTWIWLKWADTAVCAQAMRLPIHHSSHHLLSAVKATNTLPLHLCAAGQYKMLCVPTSSHLWLKSPSSVLIKMSKTRNKEVFLELQGLSLLPLCWEALCTNLSFLLNNHKCHSQNCIWHPPHAPFQSPDFPPFLLIFPLSPLLWPLLQLKAVTLLPEVQTSCHLSSITIFPFPPPERSACLADKEKHLPHKSGAELMYLLYLPVLLFLGDALV